MAKAQKKLTKGGEKKRLAVKATPQVGAGPRRLKRPAYRSFRLQKRIRADKLPSAFRLMVQAVGILCRNWKVLLGITLLYGVLNVLLVQGFNAAANLSETKSAIDTLFQGSVSELATSTALFLHLLGGSGNTVSPTAGVYQFALGLVMSLGLIWALRQVYAGHIIRIRDAFYRGMAPLVPFVLVLLVIVLQLIPVIIGMALYSLVVANGLAVTGVEYVLWAVLFFVLALVSLYMLASSLFALYVVTLPDMTPLAALRSARQLVAYRRWAVMRKVLFLPLTLLVVSATLIIPLILFATPVAAWAFFVATMLALPVAHSYMYALYRSML
jgi:hypothetical protein